MEKHGMDRRFDVSDYEDVPYYGLLRNLPAELAGRHIKYIEAEHMSDDEASIYLQSILEHRKESVTYSSISDETLNDLLAGHENELFATLESTVFSNIDNYLGQGTTAKVKSYDLWYGDNMLPLAIKYVVTPTQKTLSAEQEHDAIKEVERLRVIESLELSHTERSKYIRVPHPYLYHKTDAVDLYGMERIDGITLEQALSDGRLSNEFRESLQKSPLAQLSLNELDGYVERYFETMHQFCLHGDIKPKNLMITGDGVLYVIDFGQSILVHNIPRGTEERFENLKRDEIKTVQSLLRQLLAKIKIN